MKANNQQLENFFKQMKGPQGEIFREYLRKTKTDRLDDLAKASDSILIYRLQGEVRVIDMLLGLVTEKRG
ncbi:hypothetical protein [uncultured Parasutterella sp.]|jgi:hypothetical protein|uniref:hypothetical protein n=1 Tax=uncultured Parasutterella sp. TaxID=1263098 RepID=UPI00205CED4E|nr:hypothetical protein [uncultured Parasutterella sp.]DAJ56202.1 MAG TPA: hypothetical protein [Caudoviricetes sp.]